MEEHPITPASIMIRFCRNEAAITTHQLARLTLPNVAVVKFQHDLPPYGMVNARVTGVGQVGVRVSDEKGLKDRFNFLYGDDREINFATASGDEDSVIQVRTIEGLYEPTAYERLKTLNDILHRLIDVADQARI